MAESRDPNAEHAQAAAQVDVGMEHVADVYAEALLGAADGAGQTETMLGEFDQIVADVLTPYPEFEAVLASSLVAHEEKLGVLDRVFGPAVSPLMVNFLKVVSRHGRLDCLRAIHRQLGRRYDEQRGRVPVQLTTAAPIGADQADHLAAELQSALGVEPVLSRVVDPELIGGAVVRIGDTVYDGSIADQLRILREQMIDRSVHEIQSRRNRFRDPAGD